MQDDYFTHLVGRFDYIIFRVHRYSGGRPRGDKFIETLEYLIRHFLGAGGGSNLIVS
jgi:hypothetical protein